MKTTFSHNSHYWLTICCICHCMAATLVSGFVFYIAKQNNADNYLWILSGLLAASISVLLAMGALRHYKRHLGRQLTDVGDLSKKRPGKTDNENTIADKDPALSDIIDRLVLVAGCRRLGHETANFLNNVDLVVHGLKNENLSIRGKHILQLLTEENAKVKTYIKKQKKISNYPKMCGEVQSIKRLVEDVVLEWRSKPGRSVTMALHWLADPGVAYMNKKLIGAALINLLEYTAGFMPEGGKLDIQGDIVDNKTVIYITHENPGDKELNDMDAREPEPFTNLSIARVIIEAHGGTLCFREGFKGNQGLEVFLP